MLTVGTPSPLPTSPETPLSPTWSPMWGEPSFLPSTLPPGYIFSTCLKNSFEEPGDLAGCGEAAWVSKGGTQPLEVQGPKGRGVWTGVIYMPSTPSIKKNVCGQSNHLSSLSTIRYQQENYYASLTKSLTEIIGILSSDLCRTYSPR